MSVTQSEFDCPNKDYTTWLPLKKSLCGMHIVIVLSNGCPFSRKDIAPRNKREKR